MKLMQNKDFVARRLFLFSKSDKQIKKILNKTCNKGDSRRARYGVMKSL